METENTKAAEKARWLGHFRPTFREYAPILDSYGVPYKRVDNWLVVGELTETAEYLFFLSVRLPEMPELLTKILGILTKRKDVAYRIVSNEVEASRVANGYYGYHMAGKMIQIQPSNPSQAYELADELINATEGFLGAQMLDAVRLASVLYVLHRDAPFIADPMRMIKHPAYRVFKPNRHLNKVPKKKLIGNRYLPVKPLRQTIKGSVYKAIDLLKMEWCIVKQGNAHAVADVHGRDSRDRIGWQDTILPKVTKIIPSHRVLAYVEYGAFNFLVLDYLEGESLEDIVHNLFQDNTWNDLDLDKRIMLLNYYRSVLHILALLHENGIIHRDVTPGNFIAVNQHEVVPVDFELAFSQREMEPYPPFITGTIGYVSPEQSNYEYPMASHDLYSAGALFYYMVTGSHPSTNDEKPDVKSMLEVLQTLGFDEAIVASIRLCLGPKIGRPTANELRNTIEIAIDHLLLRKAL